MNGGVYFDGDPATDSARRHMERVLKGEPKRRWPWILAALGSGAVWMLYRVGQSAAADRQPAASASVRASSATEGREPDHRADITPNANPTSGSRVKGHRET